MKNFGKTTDIRDIITVGYEADNAVLYSTSQSLTNNQKAQARTNIGAGTSSFDGNYNSLSNKPTIPTKTSQLNNDSNFATTSQVEAKYTKPSGGIPKTDLATAVQNSLTAADNAVKYTSQSLTDAQKEQARKNIGAGTSSFSGNYKDLADKPSIPPEVSIVQSTGESTSSVMSQKATTDAVNGRLSKTNNTNIEVLGTKKATTTLGGNQLYAPNGIIFGGTAAAAGLVTRGICGITTPSGGGACTKENLYINYDGNDDFNVNRQLVLNAGKIGDHLGSNMYQYTAPRGEIVKNWVEAKGYATSVKVNGNTIASSGGVVDIGNVVTDVSGKANLAGGNTFSGVQTINAPTNVNGSEQTTMKVKTSNGGAIIFGKEGANSGTMIRLDQTDGTCRLRFRSSATAGAMVWEQPESGAQLYVDLGARGGDYHRVQFPSGAGTLALTSQIPDVSGKVNKSGDTMTGNLTIQEGNSINVSQYNDAGGVSLMNNGGGTATQFGSSTRPARMFSSVRPEWYKNGASQGVFALTSDIPDNSKHGYTELTNENLNTITEAGWYRAASGNTCTNRPSSIDSTVPFVLEVEKSTDAYIKQTLYRTGNSVSTYSSTYVRYSSDSGSSWASWGTNQTMRNGATQSFSGLKYFMDGIQLGSAVYTTGSYGSSGQFFMSQGSSSAPKWVNLQVKVNGTTHTADSSGLIDLGTISGGGTTAYATQFNEIY